MQGIKMLPQAQDDTGTTDEDSAYMLDVLDNDLGGNSISIYSVNQDDPAMATGDGEWIPLPSGARIKIVGDMIYYDPNGAFEYLNDGDVAYDTFTYTIRMGNGALSVATVTVEITGVDDEIPNTPPVAQDEVIIASVDTDAVIPVEWLLQNDSDADGDSIDVKFDSLDLTGVPAGWTVTPVNDGFGNLVSLMISTPSDAASVATIGYTVADGNGGTATGTVTIDLAAPSTAGGDSLDISARAYDFAYLEGKDGDDSVIGGLGDDVLFAGNTDGTDSAFADNDLYGDGFIVTLAATESFTGGDDALNGADDSSNAMWGDAFRVNLNGDGAVFEGGDDVVIGGNASVAFGAFNDLWGDAQTVVVADLAGTGAAATIINGNDRLVSGTNASDIMRGDTDQILGNAENLTFIGGNDTFVFGVSNGSDEIRDFRIGEDVVELTGLGLSFIDLAGLWTMEFGFLDRLTLDLDGTVDGVGDVIVFNGYVLADQGLFTSADFMFT